MLCVLPRVCLSGDLKCARRKSEHYDFIFIFNTITIIIVIYRLIVSQPNI